MNSWAKIGLSAVGAAAIIGVYFADDYYTKKEEEQKKISSKAVSFETKDVRRVVLNNADGSFAFERDSDSADWKMTQPKAIKTDQDTVNNLVSAIQSLAADTEVPESENVVKMGEDAAKYGLSKPRLNFEIGMADKTTKKLFIGDDIKVGTESGGNFIATSTYAVNPDRKSMIIVNSSIVSSTKKNFSDFRTKIAGDFSTGDVKSLMLTRNDAVVITLKKEDKDWKVVTPMQGLADNNNVGLYLDRMARLRLDKVTEAADLNDAKLTEMNLKTPSATLVVKGDGDKVLQEFKMGLTKDKVYVTMSDGAVGSVDVAQMVDLQPEFKYFRDRRVMRDASMADVLKIRTQMGKTFQKEGNSWYATVPPAGAAATPVAANPAATPAANAADQNAARVFSDWEFLTAEDIIEGASAQNLAEFGLDNPTQRFTFEYTEASKRAPEEILVGKKLPKDDKKIYVKRSSHPNVYVVETNWLEALQKLDEKPEGPHANNDKK